MDVSRRTFVKTGLAGVVGITAFGFDAQPLLAQSQALKISRTTETRSTCIRQDGDMKKAATIIYAVGWTQHSFGTQIIRAAAMVQLLR